MVKRLMAFVVCACFLCLSVQAVRAEDFDLIQAIFTDKSENVAYDSQTIVFEDTLAIKIPMAWIAQSITEEMLGMGAIAAYQPTDSLGNSCQLLLLSTSIADVTYDDLRTQLSPLFHTLVTIELEDVPLLIAGGQGDGILICHLVPNAKLYALAVTFESETAAQSTELHQMLHLVALSMRDVEHATASVESNSSETPITFESSEFETMLRKAMGKDNDSGIYPSELAAVPELYITNGIVDFYEWISAAQQPKHECEPISANDLVYFSGLQTLYLCDVELQDVDALSRLPSLRSLSLIGCSIKSCEAFASLINLKSVNLARNEIESIEPLSSLTNLQSLNLFHNQVSDLTPLATIKTLTDLSISGNPIDSLEVIASLTQLEELAAVDTQIISLEALRGHPALQKIDISQNQAGLLSLEPLSEIPNLMNVYYAFSTVTDEEYINNIDQGMF